MNANPTRRGLTLALAGIVAACATTQPGQPPSPPTLADVQQWLNALSPELPVFVNELVASKVITQAVATQVQPWIDRYQVLVTQIGQLPAGADPTAVINDTVSVLVTIAGFFPQSAPFVPLLVTAQAVLVAFLARKPVQGPQGAPAAVPAPPVTAAMQNLHAQTRAFRR